MSDCDPVYGYDLRALERRIGALERIVVRVTGGVCLGGCSMLHDDCEALWPDQRKCCPDCTHADDGLIRAVCGECGAAITYMSGRWVAYGYDGPRRFTCGPFVAHRPPDKAEEAER